MQLFFSGNSPYARRPRIAIREAGLMDRVEEVDVSPLADNKHLVMANGPGGKVPALLTDSGTFLCESLIICLYLDDLSGGKLYPAEGAAREFAFHVDGIASLLMDSLFTRSRENRRDPAEHSPGLIAMEAERAAGCYDALEGLAERLTGPVHLGMITAVTDLGYADWRHPDDDWRDGRPKLAAWFETMMARPAMAETKPVF